MQTHFPKYLSNLDIKYDKKSIIVDDEWEWGNAGNRFLQCTIPHDDRYHFCHANRTFKYLVVTSFWFN